MADNNDEDFQQEEDHSLENATGRLGDGSGDDDNIKRQHPLEYHGIDVDSTEEDSESDFDGYMANGSKRPTLRWKILSEGQLDKLWWQAYTKFYGLDLSGAECLYDILRIELDFGKNSSENSDIE
jgi:hypothetical protein